MKKILLVSVLFLSSIAFSQTEPSYKVEPVLPFDKIITSLDVHFVDFGYTGTVFDDVLSNDYVNYVVANSNLNYQVSLDTSFANSPELSFSPITGEVTLDTALQETSSCAFAAYARPYSACLKYNLCEMGTQNCKSTYSFVGYQGILAVDDIAPVIEGVTGVAIDNVLENDLIDNTNALQVIAGGGNYSVELDTSFTNSGELSFSSGQVSLITPLEEASTCANPDYATPYSACLRYKLCASGETNCKYAYAVVYYDSVTANDDIAEVNISDIGVVITNVLDNDTIGGINASQYISDHPYDYTITLDTDFSNSSELSFSAGQVSLTAPLEETSTCANPDYAAPYSACLRYKICKDVNSCQTAYAVIKKGMLVYAGRQFIAVYSPELGTGVSQLDGFFLSYSPAMSFKQVADSYNSNHAFFILDNGIPVGFGDNSTHEINYDNDGSYLEGVGRIGPRLSNLLNVEGSVIGQGSYYGCLNQSYKYDVPDIWNTIATYESGTVGVTGGGKAYFWGSNENLQSGRSILSFDTSMPYEVNCPVAASLLNFLALKKISIGHAHGVGLTEDGDVYTWGKDDDALGRSPSSDEQRYLPAYSQPMTLNQRPAQVTLLTDQQVDIDAGNGFTVTLSADGRVNTFGRSDSQALGRTTTALVDSVIFTDDNGTDDLSDDYTPEKIVAISAGIDYAMALDNNGYAWIWGVEHQSTTTGNAVHAEPVRIKFIETSSEGQDPYLVEGQYKVTNVYAGPNYQLIESNGVFYGWGQNKVDDDFYPLTNAVPSTGADNPTIILDISQ